MKFDKKLIFYLVPMFLLIMFIYLIPFINLIRYSFQDYHGNFAGFSNFIKIYDDGNFLLLFYRTLIWTFGSIIPAMIIGFIAALLFAEKFKGNKFFMTLILLPYSIPLVLVAVSWILVYNPSFGFINVFLKKIGVITNTILFLSDPNKALPAVIVARIWRAMPFAFVAYYSAMKSIPEELYEAAKVDGASYVKRILHITIPLMKKITLTVGIVLTVWTFLVFDIIFAMTGGGPLDSTNIIPIQIYREMFLSKHAGTASALGIICIFILTIITVIYWRIFREE